MNSIKNFFSVDSFLKKNKKYGDIPNVKELYKDYWSVAWPASFEGVFLNLILLADLIMVGRLGIAKAAAIGIVSQPKMIMQMIGKSLGTGVTAVIARRTGEKDYQELNSCIKQSMIITVLLYTVLVLLGMNFREKIFELMGANADYIEYAKTYFFYLTIALFFKALTAILTAVQVGVGNTRIVLKASIIGNIANVIFNYILIFGKFGFPRMEIKGAAIATIIGEFIIFLILFSSVFIKSINKAIDIKNKGKYLPTRKTMLPVIDIGFSSLLEQTFQRIGLVIFARLIAELGTIAVGTHHYCIIMWDLYYYFGLGMGIASASFAGRKLGEKRPDLAKLYTLIAQKSGFVISAIVSIVLALSRKQILSIVMNDKNAVVLGSGILIIVSLILIPQTQEQIITGTLRGSGDNRFIAIYSLFISAILKSIIAYIMAFIFDWGLKGIWLALLIDELLKMLLSKYRINTGIWLEKKV